MLPQHKFLSESAKGASSRHRCSRTYAQTLSCEVRLHLNASPSDRTARPAAETPSGACKLDPRPHQGQLCNQGSHFEFDSELKSTSRNSVWHAYHSQVQGLTCHQDDHSKAGLKKMVLMREIRTVERCVLCPVSCAAVHKNLSDIMRHG